MMTKNDVLNSDKDEIINVQLHERDLQILINLLNATYETCNKIIDNAVKVNDEKAITLYSARAQLAFSFSDKLNSYLDFAEPKSKELH